MPPTPSKEERLREIADRVRSCTQCPLHRERKKAVPGEGSSDANVMFIGEAPGRNEDLQGRPFVGAAGKLLDELLRSAGLSRQEVYITNVVKCRPPKNRDPAEGEKRTCLPYLREQVELIAPKVIVTLGRHSSREILGLGGIEASSIMRVRGRVMKVKLFGKEINVLPTLHPAAALYNPNMMEYLEQDFRQLRQSESDLSKYL